MLRALASDEDLYTPPAHSKLDENHRAMLPILADLVIPATDTPGAIEAGVPAFIDRLYSDWYSDQERQIFAGGLAQLEDYCLEHYGQAFVKCSATRQTEALSAADRESRDYQVRRGITFFTGLDIGPDAPFFVKLKHLTVIGYYMSEVGATQELVYKPTPHHYDGDYDFAKVGRQWSR